METKHQDHQDEQPVNADQVPENAAEKDNQGARPERKSRRKDGDSGRRKALAHKGGDRGNARPDEPASEFVEKVLSIKRVTKVTKGGKKLSFSALVVVGDAKGNVGYGLDKAGEVATAIKKSLAMAKKNMIKISLKGRTIPHEIIGINGAAHVLLKPASEGTGVIAAGPVRAVCDGVGIHDILTKCHRSNNPINVVKATINGLSRLKSEKRESPQVNHANP